MRISTNKLLAVMDDFDVSFQSNDLCNVLSKAVLASEAVKQFLDHENIGQIHK